MDGRDLYHQYLWGQRDFRGLNLSGIDLSGLNLSHTDFRGADLYGAKFCDANLVAVIFSEETNLDWINLDNANLSQASLLGANLSTASLKGTVLTNAICSEYTQFPLGFDFERAGIVHNSQAKSVSSFSSHLSSSQSYLTDDKELEDDFKKVMEAYVKGQYDEAIALINKLIAVSSSNPYFYLTQGNIYSCINQPNLARQAYQRVLTLTDDTNLSECAQVGLERISFEV